jgi:hypothetical protein
VPPIWTLRTSNGYVFSDPKPPPRPAVASKSEKPTRTPNQVLSLNGAHETSPVEKALAKLERALKPLGEQKYATAAGVPCDTSSSGGVS